MTIYDIGDAPYVTATFTPDPLNPAAVISAVTVKVVDPTGTVTDYSDADASVVEVSDNVWRFEFPDPVTSNGVYVVKFLATAGMVAAEQTSFKVRATTAV